MHLTCCAQESRLHVLSHKRESRIVALETWIRPPSDDWKLDLNTFYGNEGSPAQQRNGIRSFVDFYATYTHAPWSVAFSSYVGDQQRTDSLVVNHDLVWWQSNVAVKYALTETHSLNARLEYFSDPNDVMITPITGVRGFKEISVSMGYDIAVTPSVLLRAEARYFMSPDMVFIGPADHHMMLTAGMTAKF